MTDEQWVWLYANMALDQDDQMDKLCEKCKDEVTSDNTCTRCGAKLSDGGTFVNPNFDKKRFEKLSDESNM